MAAAGCCWLLLAAAGCCWLLLLLACLPTCLPACLLACLSSGPGGAVAAGLVITGKVRGSVAAEPNGRWVIKMLLIRMENKEKLARKIQRSFF